MDMFVIEGGRPLAGRVAVGGAKNAALPIMAACLMADGPVTLRQVPDLADVRTLAGLLGSLGMTVSRETAAQDLHLHVTDDRPCLAEYERVRRMRASVCVLGPLLARRGSAYVSLPGGCNIGHRPIDLHLKGLRALGAEITVERGYVVATAERMTGASIYLGGPFGATVTGTCNVMSAATLAEGTTIIEAAACEPEVVNLGEFLNRMGARIEGLGTPFLRIEGVPQLTGVDFTIIPDRIEAATLMIAAAATGGDVTLNGVRLDHLTAVVETLSSIGVQIDRSERSSVRITLPGELRPQDCIALPYPGIPTDVQAQLTALLTRADGMSIVTDKVFPDRFMHVSELLRLGADIRRQGASAIVSGRASLSGASVMASDLRASAALIIAALSAEGASVVRRVYHLDRGYERLEEKLTALGGAVRRMQDEPGNIPASLSACEGELPAPPVTGPHWPQHRTRDESRRAEGGRG